jgi:hypothetical protein
MSWDDEGARMTTEPHADAPHNPDAVELPRPTIAPLVLALGAALLASGMLFGPAFLIVGGVIAVVGLGMWVGEMLPGRGHVHEPLVETALRPRPIAAELGGVQRLGEGMPGYRLRMPEKVHPISAGIKGGIVGGAVIPIPALIWGLVSGHGILYPANLLAGMVLPGVGTMSVAELEKFHPSFLVAAGFIHVITCLVVGLVYGVLLPTLPEIPAPMAWGGLLMPLLWTAVTFLAMRVVNPVLATGVNWPWFIVSQFVFGVTAAAPIARYRGPRAVAAGIFGGALGGVVMPIPAVYWSLASGHTLWYPVNLLAGMVLRAVGQASPCELERFHGDWLAAGIAIHVVMSVGIGVVNGLFLQRLPRIPGPMAWGGLLMPLLWTGASYGLMGVVNPVLQRLVDWPWFVISQFLFGLAASVVVVRSEMVYITPAGRGPDHVPVTAATDDQARHDGRFQTGEPNP